MNPNSILVHTARMTKIVGINICPFLSFIESVEWIHTRFTRNVIIRSFVPFEEERTLVLVAFL
jgi:hypothetical protein